MLEPDRQIRVADCNSISVLGLRDKLVAIHREAIVRSVTELESTLSQMNVVGTAFEEKLKDLHGKCAVRRVVLEFQYLAVLLLQNYPPSVLQEIIEELELFGFDTPTRWAQMQLELANALEDSGKIEAASTIRVGAIRNLEFIQRAAAGLLERENRIHPDFSST